MAKFGNGHNRAALKLGNSGGCCLKAGQNLRMIEKLLMSNCSVFQVFRALQTFAAEAGGTAEQREGIVQWQRGLAQRSDKGVARRHHAQTAA